MYKKYSQGGKVNYDNSRWVVDTKDDLSNITGARMGDLAFVIRESKSYMLDSNCTWYNVTEASDTVKCDCVSELTIWGELAEPNA